MWAKMSETKIEFSVLSSRFSVRVETGRNVVSSRGFSTEHKFSELIFVGVADHGGDTGQGGNFFGSALGVASGDDDFCQRVLALHAADGGAGVLVGGIGYGTGIQYDEVGLRSRGAGEAAGFELAFEGGAVGLRGAASEVFYVVGGHGTYGTGICTRNMHAEYARDFARDYGSAWRCRRPMPRCRLRAMSSRSHVLQRSGGSRGLLLREAFAAEDGTALRGAEGDRSLLAALGAGGSSFDASVVVPVARVGGAERTATRLDLQVLQRLGSFLNCLS